ncbi:hypothetical protein [Dictyobacter kobayashii]|uniref:Uncharacterized protein n=1 Tax=Dictyobacter kobayashii TaxID=2014872 RepID=A0A402ARU4_9CHLR|nr:hypothetical protein [Dictyobacter kobayashii]GCE21817.1 hypothetical protein KDK_56170 [Dictyobacter kobayashii]
MTQLATTPVHIRIQGRSEEVQLAQLGVANTVDDLQLKEAVVRYLDLPADALASHVIVRTTQAIIIRPEALYG